MPTKNEVIQWEGVKILIRYLIFSNKNSLKNVQVVIFAVFPRIKKLVENKSIICFTQN